MIIRTIKRVLIALEIKSCIIRTRISFVASRYFMLRSLTSIFVSLSKSLTLSMGVSL